MTLSNTQPEFAWRMVLDQLRLDMPLGSFKTFVQDTEFISFENGILTIGVPNPYSRDWLADRLTSTVTRMVTGILDPLFAVQFVVHEKPLPEEDSLVENEKLESKSPPEVLNLQAVYQSVYDEIVQPDQVIVIPGYFLRYVPMLGLELSWLYIGFRQAAYEAGASRHPGKKIGAPAKKVAYYAGMSPRTFWRWAGKPNTWNLLRWLVKPVEEKARWTRGSDGRPHQEMRYYRVAMTLPLTPFDELSLRSWLFRKLGEGKKPLQILREALETLVDELLPWPEEIPSMDEVSGEPHSVQDVLRSVCTPIAESEQAQFNELADKLAQHLMPSKDLIFLTHYFVSHWLPRLGFGPGLFVALMRDRCYLNQRTGEIRDEVRIDRGYADVARWLGLKRVKTIWEWLRTEEVAIFLKETGRENGSWEESPRSFKVCLGEPMTEKDQERANRTLAKRSIRTSDTLSTLESTPPIGAIGTHFLDIGEHLDRENGAYEEANSGIGFGVSDTHSFSEGVDPVGAGVTHSEVEVGAGVTHSEVENGAGVTHSEVEDGATDTHNGGTGALDGADDIHRNGFIASQNGASGSHTGATVTHKHGASVTDIGALGTHTIGASVTIDWRDWHSLNSLTPGFKHLLNTLTTPANQDNFDSQEEGSEIQKRVVVGEWNLSDLLALNRINTKNQELMLNKGLTTQTFISWLLYAASRSGSGINDPIGHAVSRLVQDPSRGAGGAYDRLAELPADELTDLLQRELEGQSPWNTDWRTVMADAPRPRLRTLADELGVSISTPN